jgi:WD40 repeat protein
MFVQVLKVLEGHTGRVDAVAISTDGSKIVSGSEDNTVRVWSMETGQVPPASLLDVNCMLP